MGISNRNFVVPEETKNVPFPIQGIPQNILPLIPFQEPFYHRPPWHDNCRFLIEGGLTDMQLNVIYSGSACTASLTQQELRWGVLQMCPK